MTRVAILSSCNVLMTYPTPMYLLHVSEDVNFGREYSFSFLVIQMVDKLGGIILIRIFISNIFKI